MASSTRFDAVGDTAKNSGFTRTSNIPGEAVATTAANAMIQTQPTTVSDALPSSSTATMTSTLPKEREVRHDYALKSVGLGALEEQIEEDLQGEDLKGLDTISKKKKS